MISLTITRVEIGVLAAAAKNPAMPTSTQAVCGGAASGPIALEKQSHRSAAATADDHRRPEHAGRSAAADRQSRGEDFAQRNRQQQRDGLRSVGLECPLQGAIAKAEHAQHDFVPAESAKYSASATTPVKNAPTAGRVFRGSGERRNQRLMA